MSDDNNTERESKVLALYNEGKTTRDIAKEMRMSLRDIGFILKKEGLSHGITTIEDNDKNNKKSSNEKVTQAYKLFSEGKSLIEVSVELGLREKEASRFFMEFLKLKRKYRLYQLYREIEPSLSSFLKLHKVLKKKGLTFDKVEWFADAIEMGAVKLPELQDQYQELQDKVQGLRYNLQDMQYKKQELERYSQAVQQRINELTDAQNTLQETFDMAAEKVSNLYKEKHWLEQSIASHKNSNKE